MLPFRSHPLPYVIYGEEIAPERVQVKSVLSDDVNLDTRISASSSSHRASISCTKMVISSD